jgi:TRAP-type C4-dicarboxylate transport system substrate-binding protein
MNNKLRWKVSMFVLVWLAVVGFICEAHASKYNWTIGACSKGTDSATAYERFAKLLEAKSDGEIKIKGLYLGAEVCCQKSCVEQLDMKAIDIVEITDGNYGAFSGVMRVNELPFLYDSIGVAQEVMRGPVFDRFSEKIEKIDHRKLLAVITAGHGRHLWTNTPNVRTPSDIKNKKIRSVYSPAENETIRAWGAVPTPVPWGELYQALQSKLVTGHLLQTNFAEVFKMYEASPYATELYYRITQFTMILMNLDYWNSLPKKIQEIVLRSARECQEWSYENVAKITLESKERLIKLGCEFYNPTPGEMKEWKQSAYSAWQKLAPEIDKELLDMILKAQNKESPVKLSK